MSGFRDNVILLYLAAIGAIFGVTLSTAGREEILLLVPILSLGATLLVTQHFSIIGALSVYCACEIGRAISSAIPQWDASATLADYRKSRTGFRSLGQVLLVQVPAASALAMNWQHWHFRLEWQSGVWWCGLVFLICCAWLEARATKYRRRVFAQINWNEAPSGTPVKCAN